MDIILPQLEHSRLEEVSADRADGYWEAAAYDERAENARIIGAAAPGAQLPGVDWKHVVFESCRLSGAAMTKSYFSNVSFRKCDLTTVDFRDSTFGRVEFRDCKLIGANFGNCGLNDLLLPGSQADYTVFSFSRFKRVLFKECSLREAQLNEISGKEYGFRDCNLTRANFHRTSLKGVDLSTCEIDGISASEYELKGASVTALQACELAKLLGIVIVD